MTDKLLPCPFCGGAEIQRDDNGHEEWLKCSHCNATGPYTAEDEEEGTGLANAWNRRPSAEPRERGNGCLRRVIGSTVMIGAHRYGSPALVDGNDVFVRLDPDRPGLADVFSADQADLIAVAFCPELIPAKEVGK